MDVVSFTINPFILVLKGHPWSVCIAHRGQGIRVYQLIEEVGEWLTERGHSALVYSASSVNLKSIHAVKIVFRDRQLAMLFKLTWL